MQMGEPANVHLSQSLMAAGLDFVTVVDKILCASSRRNNLYIYIWSWN